ncbi:MAG: hypothetical protein COX62_03480, partial [Deltaproteobacteria bacterium CG_4_10_14_0_2_um_filter_43_8]
ATALSWLVWRITGSNTWLGAMFLAQQLPMLFLGLLGGTMADRFNRLRLLKCAQVLGFLQAMLLVFLLLLGTPQLWHILALTFVLGIVFALEFPLRNTFIMDTVGREDLLNAVSLNSAAVHICRTVGPVLAGFLLAWGGEMPCFLLNAISFLMFYFFLSLIRQEELFPSKISNNSFWEALREGLSFAWNNKHARESLLLLAVTASAGCLFVALNPSLAEKTFFGGAKELGFLNGAAGLGALIGSAFLAARSHHTKLLKLSSFSLIATSFFLILFSQSYQLKFGMLFLAAANTFITIIFSGLITLLQHIAPEELRGRIISIFMSLFMGFMALGGLLGGVLADYISTPQTILLGALFCGVSGIFFLIQHQTEVV